MIPLTAADLIPYPEYEKVREAYRSGMIALKQRRRIAVGDRITLVFENRDTVWFQIQEMVRAERIVEPSKVQDELDVYNKLLPGPGELSATLFIEITAQDRLKEELDTFLGIDRGRTVAIQVGTDRAYAAFEGGHSKEDKVSAVHFLRFPIPDAWIGRLAPGNDPVRLGVAHGRYAAQAAVPDAMRSEWLVDLTGSGNYSES
jgi:hypothetical protein